MTDKDKIFMSRALELAENGRGKVSPNPMVGCVIVANDEVIGEGWHMEYGGPHAEVNAVQAVKDKSLLSEATAYVSLEPCSHYGKTPPCADLLVKYKLKRVVICNVDPNPLVSGNGIERLTDNGIDVETEVLKERGKELNKRFFTYQKKGRPYVILKWAQTADGFIARENYDSKWISNQYSRQLVHRWRAEEDAVMVGKNTALHDNPQLTIRDSVGKNPVRIVIDRKLTLPKTLFLFDESQLTICYNTRENESLPNLEFVKVDANNLVDEILNDLYERNIQSLLLEGGREVFNAFIKQGSWDEARIFKSPTTFGSGISAPVLSDATLNSVHYVLGDQLEVYRKN